MKISQIHRSFAIVTLLALLALSAGACTAPAGATSPPIEPASSVAPAASPAASGGGKYGDEYATPKP